MFELWGAVLRRARLRRAHAHALAVLFLGVQLTVTDRVAAQSISTASASDLETARNNYRDGIIRFKWGDYRRALEAFKKADAIVHAPTTGLGVARSLRGLGRFVAAQKRFRQVAQSPVQTGESPAYAAARRTAGELAQQLDARIGTLKIVVTGLRPGAAAVVTVDDQTLPSNAALRSYRVDPGRPIQITAAALGHTSVQQSVTLADGEVREVRLSMTPQASAAKTLIGASPKQDAEQGLNVPPVAWAGFGVGAAGFVVGSIAGVLSLSALSDARRFCEGSVCMRRAKTDLDDSMVLANVANVSLVLGLAGITVGVVTTLVYQDDDTPAAAGLFVGPIGPGFRF